MAAKVSSEKSLTSGCGLTWNVDDGGGAGSGGGGGIGHLSG